MSRHRFAITHRVWTYYALAAGGAFILLETLALVQRDRFRYPVSVPLTVWAQDQLGVKPHDPGKITLRVLFLAFLGWLAVHILRP